MSMLNENDLWSRLARRARQTAEPLRPDPALVSQVLGRWRLMRAAERPTFDIWQALGFRAALAAAIATLVILVFNGATISESFGQGLSFLQEVCQVEVVP
jgi:hypothetical protein